MNRSRSITDQATPNLPSRDFQATSEFYARLGFVETWRDSGWMILKRGGLIVEFFPYPDLNPADSAFGCCFRLEDVGNFFETVLAAGVPEKKTGWPRVHRPTPESWGGTVGALIDPDGTLVRLVQAPD